MEIKPMTRQESQKFDKETMPFGKHKGQRIADVPLDYLLWLDDQPDFRRSLWRYLGSERIQAEIDE